MNEPNGTDGNQVRQAMSAHHVHVRQAPVNYYALVWALIPIMTIVGNALVVLSVVRERALQSVTNYFIVSLAVSDFIVASFVMPFGVYTEVRIICLSTIS